MLSRGQLFQGLTRRREDLGGGGGLPSLIGGEDGFSDGAAEAGRAFPLMPTTLRAMGGEGLSRVAGMSEHQF